MGKEALGVMDIPTVDALSLLRKWQDEKRLVQAGLVLSETTSCCIIGRIEHVNTESVTIHAVGGDEGQLDRHSGLSFDLVSVRKFAFEDWRDAPPQHTEALRIAYEGFLFISFDDYRCEVYACKTPDELLPSIETS